MKLSRRGFIKSSAAGAAGLAVAGNARFVEAAPAWTTRMAINSNIDNLRVVTCRDQRMVKTNAPILNFASMAVQNSASNIDKAVIQANLDEMAKALACRTDVTQAWQTIFRRPAGKTWSQVKVAIKINAIGDNHPRLCVVDKICKVLNTINSAAADANDRGVPFANMTVFDAGRDCRTLYLSYRNTAELPAVNVNNRTTDPAAETTVPSAAGNISCVNVVATSVPANPTYLVDIIVNLSLNKGHDQQQNGYVTLSMKNHLGTVRINQCPNIDMLFAMNSCDAIVGGTPPRQQLCIVDSLWGQLGGPGGSPGDWSGSGENPNIYRLIMGTFGPAVDWLTIKKVREPEIHATHYATATDQYLPKFGYTDPAGAAGVPTPTQLLALAPAPQTPGPGWVTVPGATHVGDTAPVAESRRTLMLHGSRLGGISASVQFHLPESAGRPRLTISDLAGNLVREFSPDVPVAVWDGRSASGRAVSAGTYAVRVVADGYSEAKSLVLHR